MYLFYATEQLDIEYKYFHDASVSIAFYPVKSLPASSFSPSVLGHLSHYNTIP